MYKGMTIEELHIKLAENLDLVSSADVLDHADAIFGIFYIDRVCFKANTNWLAPVINILLDREDLDFGDCAQWMSDDGLGEILEEMRKFDPLPAGECVEEVFVFVFSILIKILDIYRLEGFNQN